ncbi:MAG: energy-coupling factor transporter transmembrane component T family protein [Acidimicrobiales bacterium]
MSSAHGQAVPATRLRGPLASLPPGGKVVGLAAFLLVVAVTPPTRPFALATHLAIAIVVAVLALVDVRAVAARLTLDLPLAVLAATYALAGRDPQVRVAGVELSRPGLAVGLAILAKATIGIVAVSALAASSSVTEVVDGLASVGAPRWFRQLVALTARQLGVLRDDLQRLRLAVAVRSASSRRPLALATGARSLGTVFVRSTERADRLRLAAELRGGGADDLAADPGAVEAPTTRPARTLVVVCAIPAAAALAALLVLS